MGGEGSMQAMKTILKNNRSLLRKKRLFDQKDGIANSNTELEFESISQEDLDLIKLEIRRKAQKEQKRYRLIFFLITVVIGAIFYFVLKDFYVNFDLFFRQV